MKTPGNPPITITNVGYRSTNFWVVSAGTSRLMFDLGWPGMMGAMMANLRRMNIPLAQIRCGVASHYHIDHAGLAQEFNLAGMHLLVFETQLEAIPSMKAFTKPQDHYLEITTAGIAPVAFAESRSILAQIGIAGEILSTPGHSADSVSLILDDGSAFTGDLPPEELPEAGFPDLVTASWRALRERGAKKVYPAHGPVRPMITAFA
ncbi:MAG: MBL fold metallo-hydrolase [Anaerolineales bacterium]